VRNWEAYMSLLYAHYPVGFLYLEDLQPETLQQYKAVFVVGQMVELEAEWRNALRAAQAAGVTVYADDTCRKEIVADFRPLDMGFNHIETLRGFNVDSAYWEFPERLIENSRVLTERLAKIVPPVAGVTNPEVLMSERIGGTGRYLFVVNNTHSALPQAQLSRVNMGISTSMPVRVPVKLAAQAKAVYDVFAMKQVQPDGNGTVMADLRTMGARLYAVLPQAIDGVALQGPSRIDAGAALAYRLTIRGPAGAPIPANLPVRIRLTDANGTVIEARDTGTDAKGSASGQITVPVNITGEKLTLEATELISGKVARVAMTVAPTALRGFSLATAPASSAYGRQVVGKTTTKEMPPAETRFGTRLRDLVVTDGGKLAVASAFQWGDNLYAVDTDTGRLLWQRRVGNYWALGPHPCGDGVAVTGFDFNSAEGYHCYLLDRGGIAERRFATYGLPQQLATIFSTVFEPADPTLSFAVSPRGNWVAASGNMGIAVWQRDGKLLWSQDRWKTETRPDTAFITTLDDATLLVTDGLKLAACDVQTGAERWTHTLASSGEIKQLLVKGGVCAVLTTVNDGLIYLLRNGKVTDVLQVSGDEMALSADGTRLVVAARRALKLYTVGEGLTWSRTGDDILRFPRITADGSRVAAVSELGTLYVCDVAGAIVYQRDLEAIAVPAFLDNRDLLLATWMGVLLRLDDQGRVAWQTRVSPSHDDVRPQLLAREAVPTTRMTGWTNNTPAGAPLPPVVPGTTTASITRNARALEPQLDPAGLVDGKLDAPARPYLHGKAVQGHGGNTRPAAIQLDRGKNLVRLEAITLNEDETHPESWIRDAALEYWDAPARRWVFIRRLLADAPDHTHLLENPVEASRFRVLLPVLFYGNIRLKEITLRGTDLGPAYPPDVRAKKPVATLFDENLDEMKGSYILGFNNGYRSMTDTSAYSGANYFIFDPAANNGLNWLRSIHDPETWLFDVAENPEPGQYRYVQLAIKALSPAAKRVRLSFTHPDRQRFFTIDMEPSINWETYRVDLWQYGQAYWKIGDQPVPITQLSIECDGPMAFDQILLGRSLGDLEAAKPIR
jgi:outer membrane protein assembly factor BamB